MPSRTIVINDPTHWKGRRTARKNGSLGKERVSLEVEAEPIAHHFDSRIGAPTAEAIREVVAEQIRNITAVAKPATLRARRYAYDAFQRGAKWAQKRYAGGRIGATPPDPTKVRLFNFSGRLASHLFTRFNSGDESFTTNVPANRFDEQVWDGARKTSVLQRLSELVPALSHPGVLMGDRRVRKALEESVDLAISKMRRTKDLKTAELRRAQLSVLRALTGIL